MRATVRTYTLIIAGSLVLGLLVVGPVPDIAAARLMRAPPLDAIEWLQGCWRMTSRNGRVTDERWTRSARDTLAGTSRTLRDGAPVTGEVMHIVARGDTVVFIAEPEGQRRTEFMATRASRDLVIFENAAHDFPQRVIYRPAGDSLYARIDGVVDGEMRAVDFPMIRRACDR
jgi:hypothetical protein